MSKWFVRIDHLTDDQLSFFGWERLITGPEFSIYRHMHTSEDQVVENDPPRFLVVDDVNDATHMSAHGMVVRGPETH